MKNNWFYLMVALIVVGLWACGDDLGEYTCGVDIFNEDLFDTDTTTVKYGQALNVNNETQELFMDIYTPEVNISSPQPLVIWAFGGAFVTGNREQLSGFANLFAKKGYISASIDYRILDLSGGFPDSVQGIDIAIKATGDMKAAIRFFKQDAATDNIYNVDPDNIYVAGVSAGAITALNAAILDDSDPLPQHIREAIEANGGLEGQSGDAENLSYDSEVAGVINISGAVMDLAWIDAGDPPVISIHGDADGTVPYGDGDVVLGGVRVLGLLGSSEIHPRLDQLGIKNQLITVPGGGHSNLFSTAAFSTYANQFLDDSPVFLADIFCGN